LLARFGGAVAFRSARERSRHREFSIYHVEQALTGRSALAGCEARPRRTNTLRATRPKGLAFRRRHQPDVYLRQPHGPPKTQLHQGPRMMRILFGADVAARRSSCLEWDQAIATDPLGSGTLKPSATTTRRRAARADTRKPSNGMIAAARPRRDKGLQRVSIFYCACDG